MTVYTAAITLILVMDPLGNIPVFLSILRNYSPAKQRKIIVREVSIAFLIILVFLLFGRYILHGLHVNSEALSIAGGIILFLIAIRMIFPANNEEKDKVSEEPFIVPLAVPLTAGPSALATVVLFMTQDPADLPRWILAVILASVVFLGIMLSSQFLMKLLGRRGLVAIERLMGMILTTVAVQMFLNGFAAYLQTLK